MLSRPGRGARRRRSRSRATRPAVTRLRQPEEPRGVMLQRLEDDAAECRRGRSSTRTGALPLERRLDLGPLAHLRRCESRDRVPLAGLAAAGVLQVAAGPLRRGRGAGHDERPRAFGTDRPAALSYDRFRPEAPRPRHLLVRCRRYSCRGLISYGGG